MASGTPVITLKTAGKLLEVEWLAFPESPLRLLPKLSTGA